MTDVVVVGRLGAPYGVKGWLNVTSYTEPLDNIVGYRPWLIQRSGGWTEIPVTETRPHRNGFLVHIEGVDDRDAAQRLVGSSIAVSEAVLPKLDDDEFYWKDLIGLEVVNTSGARLGEVAELMETGANDVIVVRGSDGDVLIPFIGHVVTNVDVSSRRITVDWQDG